MVQTNNVKQKPVVLIDQRFGEMKSSKILHREVSKYGWQLFNLSTTKDFLPKTLPIVGALIQHSAEHPVVKMLKEKDIPYVRIGNFPSFFYEIEKATSVAINIAKCGHIAAKFFSERGFNHLAYIGSNTMENGVGLYDTFVQSADSFGCKVHLLKIANAKGSSKSEKELYHNQTAKKITDWLAKLPKPVGLLTYSDPLACRYISYCLDAGLDVPTDVAVLGIGNSSFICEASAVPISSIDLPWSEMWIDSLKQLKQIVKGKITKPVIKFIDPSFVYERSSTEIIGLDNPIVKKGVQFIWQNYTSNIGVDDLMKSTGASRRSLQINFQNSLGRGINEEIVKKRLDVAKRLLLNTDITIYDVALKCGYNSSNYFNKAFLKSFKCSPLEYRKKNKDKLNLE